MSAEKLALSTRNMHTTLKVLACFLVAGLITEAVYHAQKGQSPVTAAAIVRMAPASMIHREQYAQCLMGVLSKGAELRGNDLSRCVSAARGAGKTSILLRQKSAVIGLWACPGYPAITARTTGN